MKSVTLSWSLLPLLLVCVPCLVIKGLEDAEEHQFYPGPDLQPLTLGHSFCGLKQDSGTCKAMIERFYFNIHSRQCESFEYGGCDGNENNFETMEECQAKCIVKETPTKKKRRKLKQEKPAFCLLEEDSGICRGLISRYFYNKESGKCEMFKYGGCLGNANNFWTLEDCQITCQDEMPSVSDAQEQWSEKTNHSAPLEIPTAARTIGEPSLNLKQTETKQMTKVGFGIWKKRSDFRGPAMCQKPLGRGNCNANEKRFYYHHVNGKCLPFFYSGCGGNENNFNSRKSCLKVCKKDSMKIRRKKKKQSLKPSADAIIIEIA